MSISTFEQQQRESNGANSHGSTAAIPISGGNHHYLDSIITSPMIKDEEMQQNHHHQSLLQQQQQQSLLAQQQQYLAQAAALSQSHGHSPHMNLSQSMSSIGMGGNVLTGGLSLPSHQHKMSSAAMQQMSHAEKRANHNAIERARRENLNIRFLELAQSIPALLHVRKPSKSVIVSRSIDFIHETKQRLEVKTRSLQLLRQQNEEFKQEINRLRSKLGINPVVFPDNIDLDLVFETNLEHARDHAVDIPTHRPHPIQTAGFGNYGAQSPYSASFSRNGSPFDGVMSPLAQDDLDIDLESIAAVQQHQFHSQNQHMPHLTAGIGSHQSSHSILGSALQDMIKPQMHGHPSGMQSSFGSYQNNQGFQGATSASPPSSASYPTSMPTGSQLQSPLTSLHMNISGGNGSGNSGDNNLSHSYSQMDMNMAQRMSAYNQQQQRMNNESWNDSDAYSSGMKFQNNAVNQRSDDMLQFIQQHQQ